MFTTSRIYLNPPTPSNEPVTARQAVATALAALEGGESFDVLDSTIAPKLRAALQQKPVAYMWRENTTGRCVIVTPEQVVTVGIAWTMVGPLYLESPD